MTHPTPARDRAAHAVERDPGLTTSRAMHVGQPLSPRERDVLRLVADGCTNREIASALDISEQTVKNHMTSLLAKLDVTDRASAAVRYAMGVEGAVVHATDLVDATEQLLLRVRADVDDALEHVRRARADVVQSSGRHH